MDEDGRESGETRADEKTALHGGRRVWYWIWGLLGLLGLSAVVGLIWIRGLLMGSLATLDGTLEAPGLGAPVNIDRDAAGVPTIRAQTRLDAAFALGFLHAQERFFQMDLSRRRSAGTLSEVFGSVAIDADRAVRHHRFRAVAEASIRAAKPESRRLLDAYAAGVNRGLAALNQPPFEYLLLGVDPQPWSVADTVLTVLSMYLLLQDDSGADEIQTARVLQSMPETVVAFLFPGGTPWDAPIFGGPFAPDPIPGPEILDVRGSVSEQQPASAGNGSQPTPAEPPGSNNWAVGGALTPYESGMLANDMHLPLGVPNTWYRAVVIWEEDSGDRPVHRVVGATLPGTPAVIVGSNTKLSWGFTNSYGDYLDLVIIEPAPHGPGLYLTPNGVQAFEVFEERIDVREGDSVIEPVVWTIWGPLIEDEHLGPLAVKWVAHGQEAVNLELVGWETADSLDRGIDIANVCGIPGQNFVAVDGAGHVGWTIAGRLPRRVGFDGRRPVSWADGTCRWDGFLGPGDVPKVVNPENHRIWTANARVVGPPMLDKIGDAGYDLGARAAQIRHRLMERERFTERDFLAIQLDDEARFMSRWFGVLTDLLSDENVAGHEARLALRDHLADWTGRASIDSVAYRATRWFRYAWLDEVFNTLTAQWADLDVKPTLQFEGPAWVLTTQQPLHLLPSEYATWEAWMLHVVDAVILDLTEETGTLDYATWGQRNTLICRHPMSRALGFLSSVLDMPAIALPGDSKMPRVQTPTFGASERLVVSPGHEENGIFHMPGGQSGHPLSPFYRKGHDDWVHGNPSPLMPGPTIYRLILNPASAR